MCGIAGYIGKNPNEKIVKKMIDRIKYRGPDGQGYYIDENVALGHCRLAVIDLKGGKQPLYNENKNIILICNGEIYNYKDLTKELIKDGHKFKTKSDCEVILHGYEKWGKDIVKHLRGMFAFAIWDKDNQKLVLARDGFGIKPLYYYQNEDVFMFASESKAFLDHPNFEKRLNESILQSYLCFNSIATDETFFKDVYRVNPGHIIEIKDNQISDEEYFSIKFEPTNDSVENYVKKIEKAMQSSVKHHMHADVEVASLLSSGIDSSYIVSLGKPKKTYTVGYDNAKYDEIKYAKDLCKKLNIENKAKIISMEEYIDNFSNIIYHMDEPLADPAAISLYFATQLASKDVKVITSGEGADELFGGYNSYREEIDHMSYMKIPYFIRHFFSKIASLLPEVRGLNFIYRRGMKLEDYHIGIGRVFSDKEALKILKNKDQIPTMEVAKKIYDKYSNNDTFEKRQAIDFYFWLVNDFLLAADRNSSMFGLETRTPYLDNQVYEVARHLPKYAKLNKVTTKPALRMAASNVIPNESYKKKKLGFPVPLREWIKEDTLYSKIKEMFESNIAENFFDQKYIIKLLDNHRNGKKDTYKKVWCIYTFLVWYEDFFVKEKI